MESTVLAPYAGEVTAVEVMPNAQVGTGAPLLRIRETDAGRGDASAPLRSTSRGSRPDPRPGRHRASGSTARCVATCSATTSTRRWCRRLLVEQRRLGEISPPADPGLLRCEDGLLDLFAEVSALYRPRTDRAADALTSTSTQEFLLAYLQWLDPDRAGLPDAYRERSGGCLGAIRDRRSRAHAGSWKQPSSGCSGPSAGSASWSPVVMSILERRLRAREAARAPGRRGDARLLDRFDRWRRRLGTRPSPSWLTTWSSATSTSPCWRLCVEAEDEATERALAVVEADPVGPGSARGRRAAGQLARTPSAGRCCGTGWPPATPTSRRCCWRSTPGGYYRIRELRGPAVRRARRPAPVRRRLRLGEQAHPPGRRLRRAGRPPDAWLAPSPRTCAAYPRTDRSPST